MPGTSTQLESDTAEPTASVAQLCLSIDLEVGPKSGRINEAAAVRGNTGESWTHERGNLAKALRTLDVFAEGSSYLLGHNFAGHDAPHLAAAAPNLRLLRLPQIDTLRINPLAFPRNPYHHLVKDYQNGKLKRAEINNPELDARLTLALLDDQQRALSELVGSDPDLLIAWHWLTAPVNEASGMNALFAAIRGQRRPSDQDALAAIQRRLRGNACGRQASTVADGADGENWPLAYAMAWISVAGGNSVMPPWVRHQFPEAGRIVRQLRDTPCDDPSCDWCREHHDPTRQLKRWFGFDSFRPEPKDEDGRPLQETIVQAAMRGEPTLGILPTGTGKSLCYQLAALSAYEKTGALTVVISPLVALMADQVAGLEAQGISGCAAFNGLLSMPERADVLDRIRLGDVGIVIISPEQLRNPTLRHALEQREIGLWVLDEAHCLSKWGHAFRPDYRYITRFIKDRAGEGTLPAVLCLTATAKLDVVEDIRTHFRDRLGMELTVYNGGAERTNLDFAVVPTTPAEKLSKVAQLIEYDLPDGSDGGAIVYCATRRHTEEVAEYLRAKGMSAAYFHAGLPPETKKTVQEQFIAGELRIIAATNAFGMGIDKPDVRLVVHADIPGSLENYLQEAGRAGRDRKAARCVLLYVAEDVERQFGMSARSRLSRQEIQAILKALRNLDRKGRRGGEIVATPGEILTEEEDARFLRDQATDDTRVKTAICWLEEARLLARGENEVKIFPSSLKVASLDEARRRLAELNLQHRFRTGLMKIVEALFDAGPDEGVSTDELMVVSGLSPEGVRKALHDLARLGIASNDLTLTAFVHAGIARSSLKRLEDAFALEKGLIESLQETVPDLSKGETSYLNLRIATQHLRDAGVEGALPERLRQVLKGLARDGRGEDGGAGSMRLKSIDRESLRVTLGRDWTALARTAELRRDAAQRLLEHLLEQLDARARGADLLVETTVGELHAALENDLLLKNTMKDPVRLLERALLWLHEMEVVRLNKGLAVFRSAMTIQLNKDGRQFLKADFEPLRQHYDEQVVQIHVMAEYAHRGLEEVAAALRLTMEYFSLGRTEFLDRWLPVKASELHRQTLPESWKAIVEDLNNPVQQQIVADVREQTNVLVLAGPGSGKTRVLVHRIAYLIRVRRENPRGILALAYNRHAAVEIRERLRGLLGDDARGVTVLTCHGLAMRLAGYSFAERQMAITDDWFDRVLNEAVSLLEGEGLPADEADEQRTRLLSGFRWILVDEYQDVEAGQYGLISALAGRTLNEEDRRLSLFAVGDDDQNIYAFGGASVEFIRRFEEDYRSKPAYLTENYRSTAHIVEASNLVIEEARERMKAGRPITVPEAQADRAKGGPFAKLDPVARGRVQILPAGPDAKTQAVAVVDELSRLSKLAPDWNWARCAVIARNWSDLEPVRAYCEHLGIPAQLARDEGLPFWRLRETQALVAHVRGIDAPLLTAAELQVWIEPQPVGPGWELAREALHDYALETPDAEMPPAHFLDWLAEWGRDARRKQKGLLLSSAHRVKGLEFDHVAVLDGAWDRVGPNEDPDAPRRLYYVAMTRARHSLLLARTNKTNRFIDMLPDDECLFRRERVEESRVPYGLDARYERLTLKDIYLGYAGNFPDRHFVHRAIARLQPGDSLQLAEDNGRWRLTDDAGRTVGRLAKSYRPPPGTSVASVEVAAVVAWRAEDADEDYRERMKCEAWEVVVPEIVYR